MPLYEYRCQSCNKVFEVIQKFSDEPLTTHAGCGGKVERLLSAPALQFKGTGWYVTDYAHKNGSSGNGHHKTETKDSKTEKSETKPKESPAPAKSEPAPKTT